MWTMARPPRKAFWPKHLSQSLPSPQQRPALARCAGVGQDGLSDGLGAPRLRRTIRRRRAQAHPMSDLPCAKAKPAGQSSRRMKTARPHAGGPAVGFLVSKAAFSAGESGSVTHRAAAAAHTSRPRAVSTSTRLTPAASAL